MRSQPQGCGLTKGSHLQQACNPAPGGGEHRRATSPPRPCAEGCGLRLRWAGQAPGRWGAMPVAGAVRSLSHCLDLPLGSSWSWLPKAAVCPSARRRALSLPILQNSSPSPQKPGSRLFSQVAPVATSVAIWRCCCFFLFPRLCIPTLAWLQSSAPGPAAQGKDLALEK